MEPEATGGMQAGRTLRWIAGLWGAGSFLRRNLLRIRSRIIGEATLILVLSLLGFVAPLLSQYAIDSIILAKDATRLGTFLWVSVAFLLVSLLVRLITARIQAVTRVEFAQGIRTALVDKIGRMDSSQHAMFKTGDYIYRLVDDAMAVSEPIISIHASSITAILTFMVAVAILVAMSAKLCLVVIGSVAAGALTYQVFKRKMHACTREEKQRHQAAITEATNFFSNLLPIRLMACFETTTACVNTTIWAHGIANKSTRFLVAWSSSCGELLRSAFHLGLVGYGSFLVIRNEMTLGSLVAFMAIAAYATSPIQFLTSAFMGMQPAMISVSRIGQIMELPDPPRPDGPAPALGDRLVLGIRDFRVAKDGRTIISCHSMDTRLDAISAIIGPNGAGKSTFARILAGVEDRYDGRVSINGIDLRSLDGARWARLVTPDCFLLNDSLRQNLLLGSDRPSGGDREMEAAIAIAFGDRRSSLFPQGLSTRIQQYGAGLSTGERCRINCARAIIRKPALAILDDTLHNIDADAAAEIVAAMAASSHVIIVSSRESDGAQATSLISMHSGSMTIPETINTCPTPGGPTCAHSLS